MRGKGLSRKTAKPCMCVNRCRSHSFPILLHYVQNWEDESKMASSLLREVFLTEYWLLASVTTECRQVSRLQKVWLHYHRVPGSSLESLTQMGTLYCSFIWNSLCWSPHSRFFRASRQTILCRVDLGQRKPQNSDIISHSNWSTLF